VALAASIGIGERRVSAALRSVGVVPTSGRLTLLARRVLVDGYVRRGLSADALAGELGCSSQKVRDDLRRHGLTLRPTAQSAPGLDAIGEDGLRSLYVEEGLTLVEIAERVGCSPGAVGKRLRRAGVKMRPRGGPARPPDESDVVERLRELYVEQGLSVLEVARRFGRSRDWVITRLERFGLPRRGWQKKPRLALPASKLRRLWVDEGRSLPEVAERFCVPADWVRAELAR
jgi:transposase-like protein